MILENAHAVPPTADRECLEAIWSHGRGCKNCFRGDCYRQGWEAASVTDDNLMRVAGKHGLTPHELRSKSRRNQEA